MTRAVHQFVPRLEPGAVGNHMLEAQRVLRTRGFTSEIFAAEVDARWEGRGHRFAAYGSTVPMQESDVLIYQYAIGSPMADAVRELSGTIVVNSHTQTPPALLDRWDPAGTYGVTLGMKQLGDLASVADLGIAVSEHNAAELREAGFGSVVVVPVFTDTRAIAPDPAVLAAKATDGNRWLFVGRVSANKQHHKLVQAFAWYRAEYDPQAELVIVGSGLDGRYARAVRRYVADLELNDAVRFTGPVSDAELAAHYQCADVFVALSAHEGFCVPLLESMRAGVPIVAFASSAIPETLGDAGVLLDTDRPSVVATAVHRVLTDDDLRRTLIEQGRLREQDFAPERVAAAFVAAVESLT